MLKLLDKYEEAASDPELLSLRGYLGVIDMRLATLIERADSGESAERWRLVLEKWSEYKNMRGSALEMLKFVELDNLMTAAFHDYQAWKELLEAVDVRRKLTESERKRLLEMKQIITAEDAARLVTALQGAVIRIIDDPAKLKLIEWEFIKLSGIGNIREPEPSVPEESLFDASGLDTGKLLDS